MNLLGLDAPIVAVVWQDFLARCYPSVLPPAGRLVLFLSVWAIYIADRMVDVRNPAHENESTRHRFYRHHGTFAAALLGVVTLADFLAVALWLRPAVWKNGLIVAALVVLYMAIFPSRRTRYMRWKQPSAAALFTMGVFLIAWTGTPDAWRTLGAPAAAFGALCLGNMRLIEHTERERGRRNRGLVPAGKRTLTTILAFACLVAGRCWWSSAIAASAAGLVAVDYLGARWPRDAAFPDAAFFDAAFFEQRRVLADLALLTPLLLRVCIPDAYLPR